MRANRIQPLSLVTLLVSALVVGCDPPPVPDGADCSDGDCVAIYECVAPLGLPEYQPVVLCNCTDVTSLGLEGFRPACYQDQGDADDFCHAECIKAALQNGHTQAQAEESCQWSQAMPVLDEYSGYQSCYYEQEKYNKPLDYSPQALCPNADGTESCDGPPPGSLPYIYCHGTAEPTDPGSFYTHDFNEQKVSFWLETWEIDAWHYTATDLPFDTGCGYMAYPISFEGLGLTDDEMCVETCKWYIDYYDGASADVEGYDDDVRILRHNCESFVAGSLCSNGPVAPALVGPVTVPLTLAATLDTGSSSASTTFAGQISYSTYACAAGTTNCPILIHDLTLALSQPVSGQWPSAAGTVPFSSSDLRVAMTQPISGLFAPSTSSFVLRPGSIPLDIAGLIALGTAGSPQRVSLNTNNADAVAGSIASDGSIVVSGSFEFAPGMTVSFGNPAPQ